MLLAGVENERHFGAGSQRPIVAGEAANRNQMTSEIAMQPISYSIDKTRNVIFEVWRGDVTAADLRSYWEAYLANPEVMAMRRTVVDLREANILFTGKELAHLVSSVAIPGLKGLDWKTAIVVEQPVQFGVSRQYHFFAEQYSTDSIFFEPEEALCWLLQQPVRL